MRYPKIKDNEWVRPRRKSFRDMCCDCGLVHLVDYRIVTDGARQFVEFRVKRHGPATGGARSRKHLTKDGKLQLP